MTRCPHRRRRDRTRRRRAARGGLVAFPTETVYGLGADAVVRRRGAPPLRGEGPARRPSGDRPPRRRRAARRAGRVEVARRRARACRARAGRDRSRSSCRARRSVPDAVTGGLDTVGLRVPDQPLALALLDAFGGGVAAPSANRFGRVSPTTAARRARRPRRRRRRRARRRAVPRRRGVDDRRLHRRRARDPARSAASPRERSSDVARPRGRRPRPAARSRAPGTLASHYAPTRTRRASSTPTTLADLRARRSRAASASACIGARRLADDLPRTRRRSARRVDVDEYAHDAVPRLRDADARGLDVVLAVRAARRSGIGAAVADRLRRAARGRERAAMSDRRARSASSTPGSAGSPCCGRSSTCCPTSDIVYFGDTGRFPYGPKPADEVLKYSLEIADVLARPRREDARGRVQQRGGRRARRAAASSSTIPVIGVIEPGHARRAPRSTATGRVGVIGTVGTIASGAYQRRRAPRSRRR